MILNKNTPLYASKFHTATDIIAYNNKNVKESADKCDARNISWFGKYKVAKSYETSSRPIRQWKTVKSIHLIEINAKNEEFFRNAFLDTKEKLIPMSTLVLSKDIYYHPYINDMTINERCLYEFKFAFGYITIKEQYEFVKLFSYLIDKNHICQISRDKDTIPSYKLKMYYYSISLSDKNKRYQRFSIYHIDKIVIRNLCKTSRCDGVYQQNSINFWNPNFLVFERFRKNIEEYILFRPQDVLEPVENVEEYVTTLFIDFFKKELKQNAVINGGYGIKKVLEYRYGINLNDTKDIDVMVGEHSDEIVQKWDKRIDEFLEMIDNPLIVKKYTNFKGKFVPQFNYNTYKVINLSYLGTDLVDIMFTNYLVQDEILDKKSSEQSHLPLKKMKYYLEDMLKLIYQTNIEGVNKDVYKKRNPIGQKIIDRTKLICKVLVDDKDEYIKYKKACSLVKHIESSLTKSNEDKKKIFQDLLILFQT